MRSDSPIARRAVEKPVVGETSGMHCAESLEFMSRLPDGCCDLIYIDPPFCSGKTRTVSAGSARARRDGDGSAGFSDRWQEGVKSYMAFLFPRLRECRRLLARRGTLYVHLDWRASHYVKIQLDTVFGSGNFLNEIIWHYRSGGASKRWFGRKHDAILVYAKRRGQHRFNPIREGAYRTDGIKLDGRGRPYKSTRAGRVYFSKEGPLLSDVWDLPFLSTVSLERTGWPTQKPLSLLDRIIRASTNSGDLVADFFCGSGTSLVAAKKLGRRFVGCDESAAAVAIARRRLAGARSLFD